jgi:hypothetical protein
MALTFLQINKRQNACCGMNFYESSDAVKVHSHVCFKATYKLLIEQLASIPLVESDFLATLKLL